MRQRTYGKIKEVVQYVTSHTEKLNEKQYVSKANLNEVAAQLFIDEIKQCNKNIKTRNYKENFYIDVQMTKSQITALFQLMENIVHDPFPRDVPMDDVLITNGIMTLLFKEHSAFINMLLERSSFFLGFTVKDQAGEKIIDAASNNKIQDIIYLAHQKQFSSYRLPMIKEDKEYKVTLILGKTFNKSSYLDGNADYFHNNVKAFLENLDNIPLDIEELIFVRELFNGGLNSIFTAHNELCSQTKIVMAVQDRITNGIFFLANLFNIFIFINQHLAYTPKLQELLEILKVVFKQQSDEQGKQFLTKLLTADEITSVAQGVLAYVVSPTNPWPSHYIGALLEDLA